MEFLNHVDTKTGEDTATEVHQMQLKAVVDVVVVGVGVGAMIVGGEITVDGEVSFLTMFRMDLISVENSKGLRLRSMI